MSTHAASKILKMFKISATVGMRQEVFYVENLRYKNRSTFHPFIQHDMPRLEVVL